MRFLRRSRTLKFRIGTFIYIYIYIYIYVYGDFSLLCEFLRPSTARGEDSPFLKITRRDRHNKAIQSFLVISYLFYLYFPYSFSSKQTICFMDQ